MARSETIGRTSFTLQRPGNNVVTFELPDPADERRVTTFKLPVGSKWTPRPHWHERYTEYVKVVQGRARIMLDGKAKIVMPEDGVQTIHKFVVHEFMRADIDDGPGAGDKDELVIEEWTDPSAFLSTALQAGHC